MLSQLFVLSTRGDAIVSRDYRHDVSRSSHEAFFRALQQGADDGERPPVFCLDGVNYFHVKAGGLLLCATTRDNLSPSLVLELLQRVARVIKDYCGILSEDNLRKNFVLVYELLDEMIDYGYGQNTSTEALKASVFNDPVTPPQTLSNLLRPGTFGGEMRAPPTAVARSVLDRTLDRGGSAARRSEIFVDVVERLTVTFNGGGYMLTSEVDGAIQCKSFLVGNPQIRLALNEDLVVSPGAGGASGGGYDARPPGGCFLDDVTFHEKVSPDKFETDRSLLLTPPAGEFTAMAYRASCPFKPPFRCGIRVAEPAPFKLEVTLLLKADFPSSTTALNVQLRLPLPKNTSHASVSVGRDVASLQPGGATTTGAPSSQHGGAELNDSKKELVWSLNRVVGGSEHALRCKATLTVERCSALKKEVGPASLAFALPNHSVSQLQVRFLQVLAKPPAKGEAPPARWVRYLTTSSDYVFRL